MVKKLISVLLTVLMMVGAFSIQSFSADTDCSEINNKSEKDGVTSLPSNAFLKEGAECYLDCSMNIDEECPIYFKFNSLSVSKEIGDFDLCDDWNEIKDENGTITNEYSYVICNITILNKGEVDFETTLNNLWLYFETNAGYTEARAYNSNKKDVLTKDYYYCTFKPDTEYNFNMVYVVEDDVIAKFKSDMLIFISFIEPMWDKRYPVIEK